MVPPVPADARPLPLRERKKLRTRRALADTALRLFAERGLDATTVDDLVDAVEVSKSTFFRTFPTKEAAATEAEAELWSAFAAALGRRALSGPVLGELRETLCGTVTALGPEWTGRYAATRRLALGEPALLAPLALHRAGGARRTGDLLTAALGLPPDDLRPRVLAELTATGWDIAARDWVSTGGRGGPRALLRDVGRVFRALPACLELTAEG
ncbi:TetR/AcrR family transcriptional regulator [Streptomyces sp. NPDC088557]|uniref:TetR/AcrR family transcriptional regulator n=1 Tax=Streptomyces sp. NPDC088557 TaxID=3365867 RepID=UPI003809AF83